MAPDEVALLAALLLVALVCYKYFFDTPASGARASSSAGKRGSSSKFLDQYRTWADLHAALRRAGLESSNLIVGIDLTRSNEWSGAKSFGNRCLHDLPTRAAAAVALSAAANNRNASVDEPGASEPQSGGAHAFASTDSPELDIRTLNPYQAAIYVMGRTLEAFDEDQLIPTFGFGDAATTDQRVVELQARRGHVNHGFAEVLAAYEARAAQRPQKLSGPTSFEPLIRKAIEIVRETQSYHILLIIADGQVENKAKNIRAIVEASAYPLSIIMVGVGDGPWDTMRDFDDEIPERRFDNFQFVCLTDILQSRSAHPQMDFAVAAMQEIPDQYAAIRRLGLF
jgi:E3 ubiquitin-protein ligase RGLG